MDSVFNEEQIAEIKELFILFDKDDDGLVETKNLGTMIRGLGYYPTNNEILELEQEIDNNNIGNFDFPEFLTILADLKKPKNGEEELYEAFLKIAEDDKKSLALGRLKFNLGQNEDLSKELILDLLEEAKTYKTYSNEKDKEIIHFSELIEILLYKYN